MAAGCSGSLAGVAAGAGAGRRAVGLARVALSGGAALGADPVGAARSAGTFEGAAFPGSDGPAATGALDGAGAAGDDLASLSGWAAARPSSGSWTSRGESLGESAALAPGSDLVWIQKTIPKAAAAAPKSPTKTTIFLEPEVLGACGSVVATGLTAVETAERPRVVA